MIATTDFFGTKITRLILGDNPFGGHSYIPEHPADEMMDYYTADKCVRALFTAEESGINTCMPLADPFILRVLRQYRNEGGKMNIIFQSFPAMAIEATLQKMIACNPIGIYHQGGMTDLLCEEDRVEDLVKNIELLRATHVPIGIGTHDPVNLLRAESENWGADFYTVSLYNFRRTQIDRQNSSATKEPGEVGFIPEDPPIMYKAIRTVKKQCIAIKIFAGGNIFCGKEPDEITKITESVFTDIYRNIKPCDVACMGAFQKFSDQIGHNAAIAERILTITQ